MANNEKALGRQVTFQKRMREKGFQRFDKWVHKSDFGRMFQLTKLLKVLHENDQHDDAELIMSKLEFIVNKQLTNHPEIILK